MCVSRYYDMHWVNFKYFFSEVVPLLYTLVNVGIRSNCYQQLRGTVSALRSSGQSAEVTVELTTTSVWLSAS